ncbi:hypothetical protein OE88DRAFT_611563 [Heliocybe sulcata]|uniref:Autophagy-related protein 29 n=1 Tax=Heliocybe sulcata TaxID=5364 RepID=A0A5C3NC38_9AGAM|nr:hypothetical protein OE88DRAFT_611563 [Heliocybe sulcata]
MATAPKVRVIVRLPYNRPEDAPPDPPKIEWTPEKENILWEVIARSRAADSGGTDWKGLAAHLQVPLPYLLYRAQTRYEQDLRGLQDIKGTLSPTAGQGQGTSKNTEYFPDVIDRPSIVRRASGRLGSDRLSSSTRLSTPVGGRLRLGSLPSRPHKAISSSTITLRGPTKQLNPPLSPPSPSRSSDEEESDEEAARAEKIERELEEQEALERKLQGLQRIMTNDTIGLIRSPVPPGKGKEVSRGRIGLLSPRLQPMDSSQRPPSDRSQSLSSTSSPQGSIPDMPSPPPESRRGSPIPIHQHMPSGKSTSPSAVSHRNARGQSHMRYATMPTVARRTNSEKSSNYGSSASSFSDLSDADLSSSALESALMSNMSNIKGGGSRASSSIRTHLSGRKGMPQ